MKHLVFPTYELHPVNSGGAGVFVSGAMVELARAGHRCTALCHFPDGEVEQANAYFAGFDLGPGSIRAVTVDSLMWGASPDPRLHQSHYELNSERFAVALERLSRIDPFDYVEFPEYAGIGYATMRRRLERGAFAESQLGVRIHGSLELIDQAEGVPAVERARLRMFRAERLALKLADVVLGPSKTLCAQYAWAHGLERDRTIVSPPPMGFLLQGLQRATRTPDPGHFLFYGKLQEVKGCDAFVEAGVSLLLSTPEIPWRFTLVGRDTHCARHERNVSECLSRLMPGDAKFSFEFLPGIPRERLHEIATHPTAAVVPSRFESFCLAAHELRAVGLPLIVPPLPGFQDWLTPETGCLPYDGTANGLANAMLKLATEPLGARALAARPPPSYPAYSEAYADVLQRAPRPLNPEYLWQARSELRAMDDMSSPQQSLAPSVSVGSRMERFARRAVNRLSSRNDR